MNKKGLITNPIMHPRGSDKLRIAVASALSSPANHRVAYLEAAFPIKGYGIAIRF